MQRVSRWYTQQASKRRKSGISSVSRWSWPNRFVPRRGSWDRVGRMVASREEARPVYRRSIEGITMVSRGCIAEQNPGGLQAMGSPEAGWVR